MHLNCAMCLTSHLCFRMDKYKTKGIRGRNGNMNKSRRMKRMQLVMTAAGMKVLPLMSV